MNPETMSTSRNPARRHPIAGPKDRSWVTWFSSVRILVIVFSVLAFGISLFIYFQATHVTGRELNARTWEIRRFSFRRDPFSNMQLTGIKHSAPNSARMWAANTAETVDVLDPLIRAHLSVDKGTANRWDLVNIRGLRSFDGDARILVNLLRASDSQYGLYWEVWTKDEPTKAAMLWPAVQHLVGFGLYTRLPSLFEVAANKSTNDQFKSAVGKLVQQTLVDYCSKLAESSDVDLVRSVANVALTYGDHPELQEFVNFSN